MSKKNSLSLFFIFAFCLTFLLGTWQYQRLNWKNNLINNIEKSVNKPFSFDEIEIYPELTRKEVEFVCEQVNHILI